MGYASAIAANLVSSQTEEQRQRDYLISRLRDIRETKAEALRKQFGLSEKAPDTVNEAIQLIKDGKFRISAQIKGDEDTYNPLGWIRWNLTSPDKAGYEVAIKTLKDAYTAAKDQVMVLPVADGLKAVQSFQA